MARVFIHYDSEGQVLSVAKVEAMDSELPHPYVVLDPTQGVVEIPEDDPALQNGIEHVQQAMQIDPLTKKLVPQAGTAAAKAIPRSPEAVPALARRTPAKRPRRTK